MDCTGAIPMIQASYGMRILAAAGVNEMDVHSNSIYSGDVDTACTSHAVNIDVVALTPPTAPVGIFRNNILRAGQCTTARPPCLPGRLALAVALAVAVALALAVGSAHLWSGYLG